MKVAAVSLAAGTNPYRDKALALANSSYSAWREDKLVRVCGSDGSLSPLAECAHARLRQHILESDFPCTGAKAAFNGNCYRFGFYPEMNTPATTAGLAFDLWEYTRERLLLGTNYATFVASFAAPVVVDEKSWENLLWAQLQNLRELDRPLHAWDETVSSDPESADFSFSFAQTGFFIVGLHPASSRKARKFAYPTMVFNAHAQFEQLRQQNQFDRMKQTIRSRDLKLQGSLNPNLSNFGERSEARQYSGRAVEENWRCPFRA
jgi:FPC/CPF motif-containing protein YcgG